MFEALYATPILGWIFLVALALSTYTLYTKLSTTREVEWKRAFAGFLLVVVGGWALASSAEVMVDAVPTIIAFLGAVTTGVGFGVILDEIIAIFK